MADLVQTAQAGIPWLARLAPAPEPKPAPRQWIAYDVPLSYDNGAGEHNRVRLVLPQDMSTEEAERVCGFIRALAFTDEELAAERKPSLRKIAP